jgi:predicted RNase H-like HicB family nuclease
MEEKPRFTAIVERDGHGWMSVCPELEVASQGRTEEEARRNLAEAVELFLEAAGEAGIARRLAMTAKRRASGQEARRFGLA